MQRDKSFSLSLYLPQSQVPHKYTRRAHSSGLLLRKAHLGQRQALFRELFPPAGISFLLTSSFSTSPAHHTLQDLSPARWGHSLNVFPKREFIFQLVGRCIQATFSLFSHTDRGFRKCQPRDYIYTFLHFFFFHV